MDEFVLEHYRGLIERSYPAQANIWPLISGRDCRFADFRGWRVIILTHTGNAGVVSATGIGELPEALIGCGFINAENREVVRSRIEKHFALQQRDGVVFISADGLEESELIALMRRHEFALGLAPMKLFLSHKGYNKPLVRQFKQTLALLGFDPWLDEDAMPAGANLERGILK